MIKAVRIAPLLIGIFVLGIAAQDPPKEQKPPQQGQGQPGAAVPAQAPCPTLNLQSASPQVVRDGAKVRFVATITGGDTKVTPILSWSISSGVMISGQGTPTIEVDSTGAAVDKSIRATLLVGGYSGECPYSAEATIKVVGPARKVHEYGTVTDEQQAEWIARLVAALAPDEQAYVISYAGRTSARGAASANIRKIKADLTKAGTPNNRLIALDGGYREELITELWIVPMGAETPRPTPTINAKDIVFPKPTPPVKRP